MSSERRGTARFGGALRRPLVAVVAVVVVAFGAAAAGLAASRGPALSRRDIYWQQDVAYLARRLPLVHVQGLTGTSRAAWDAAASRLEAEVPRLSNGQVIVGMARMVAMLHDDETTLTMPPSPVYPFAAQFIGAGLYLIDVPWTDRDLLGARLVAVDGHPIAAVLAGLRGEIDYQDAGLARDVEIDWGDISPQTPGYLNNADLLNWLGITRSVAKAAFAVQPVAGQQRTVWLTALGASARAPRLASIPLPAYLQRRNLPYWMQTMPSQRVVYLKYNDCLATDGFQQLAARALQVLRLHPGYRLIVDLRDNPGGDSEPFQALVHDIQSDPVLNQPGRVIGLINGLTDSSASVDAYNLSQQTRAVLIGEEVADPIDEFGDDNGVLRLPHGGIEITYTTAVVNPTRTLFGIPTIVVAPTLHDVLIGADPVLQAAVRYRRGA